MDRKVSGRGVGGVVVDTPEQFSETKYYRPHPSVVGMSVVRHCFRK